MNTPVPLLTGETLDPRDRRIIELTQEVDEVSAQLAHAEQLLAEAQRQNTRGLSALRRALSPLYNALQDVFGELDKAGVQDEAANVPTNGRVKAIWDSWKSRMGNAAPVIDALLLQPGMNQTQIAIAIGRHRTTVPALIFKLKQAGLIEKNGDRFSLKSL
jgi:hypothetical protein